VTYYVDSHVVKIPLEIAQLLCTAVNLHGEKSPYKTSFKNHPLAIWTRSSSFAFHKVKKHGLMLCEEYTYRYGKRHKCQDVIEGLECPTSLVESQTIKYSPPQCMPEDCKSEDYVDAYRKYYIKHKQHLHKWKKREKPIWMFI